MSRKDTIRQQMEADHASSLSILKSLTPEQWAIPVPSDEGAQWVAKDVLSHLAVSEAGHVGQITRAVAGEDPVPPDFDLARFNRRSAQKQADKSVEILLAELESAYAQLLAKLDVIVETDLDKQGRHARGDTLTVEGFFRRCAEHRRQHAEALRSVISGQ
jgi:hypothetical protein